MHVLFVHSNFPAQFGRMAAYLVEKKGFRCTYISEKPPGSEFGIERVQYHVRGGATVATHYCSRMFENAVWHTHAIYEALGARPDIKPDLIVGHAGFASTLFLRELYDCPIINYFEYFCRPHGSEVDFRPDFPCTELIRLRARARNAMLLLDLDNCDAGYSPTRWQRDRFPETFHSKLRVIFDGMDTDIWRPVEGAARRLGPWTFPDDVRIVTYVSRGLESMRGFDIFMKIAKRLCDRRADVVFVVVGEDRICYSDDQAVTGEESFKNWVLSQDDYDLSRILFTGRIPPRALVHLFSISDLHIYLTVPFVLSWSLMNALACGVTVLASDTAPVREMIEHGKNGLLVDFFDVDTLVQTAEAVLDDPQRFRHLGAAGMEMVRSQYNLDLCLSEMLKLYEEVLTSARSK